MGGKEVTLEQALKWAERNCTPEAVGRLRSRAAVATLAHEVMRIQAEITKAPIAIMDTRDFLGICAPTEEDFPALYALQGKRVRLLIDGEQ